MGVDFGTYINPDEIALTLGMPEPQRSIQAQHIADQQRDACLQKRRSFSFETVMSHQSKVEIMIRADDAGYDVTLFFVGTSDPEINVRRVENRVSSGGHDVPHERIRARYLRSMGFLCHAALVAQRTVVFDNSALVGYSAQRRLPDPKSGLRPVAEVIHENNRYEIVLEENIPEWVFEYLVKPLDRLAQEPGSGVGLSIRQSNGPLGTFSP